MPNPLVIQLRLEGAGTVQAGIRQVAGAVKGIGPVGAAAHVGAASNTVQMLRVQSAGVQGPFSRLMKAQQDLANIQRTGTDAQVKDARLRVMALQRVAAAADNFLGGGGKTFADRLQIFGRSARLGPHGIGLQPRLGRTMDLFGAAAGKMAGAAVVAGVALVALMAATNKAAEVLRSVGNARFIGGGTLGEAAQARGLGAALGMSAAEVAGLARGFAERLASDPMAMGFGAGMGMIDFANPLVGRLDKFRNFFKMVRILTEMPDERQAVRLARIMGPEAEAVLPLRDVSPGVRNRLLGAQEGISKDKVRAAADFNAEMAILNLRFQELLLTLTPVIRGVASFTKGLSDWLQTEADFMRHPLEWLLTGGKGKTFQDEHKKATEQNTDALRGLRTTMTGIFGGGERARSAVPRAWTGAYGLHNQMWEGEARMLGAFTV